MKADLPAPSDLWHPAAFVAALAALCTLLPSGCGRAAPPAHKHSPPTSLPAGEELRLDSPQLTARTLLILLREELRAIRLGDRSAQLRCRQQLERLADRATILQRFASTPQVKMLLGEDLVAGVINQWGATIAFYAEGLELDQIAEPAASTSTMQPTAGLRQVVRVRGHGKAGEPAWIHVHCVLGEDGLWRVTHVDFAGGRGPVQSQPASLDEP